MGQLLMYSELPSPTKKDKKDMFKFMVQTFVPKLRTILKDGGYSKISNNEETIGTFLVGVSGHLFTIESDLQVAEQCAPYAAVGCGDDLAKGSMHSLCQYDIPAEDKIQVSLEAAQYFSSGVCGPFIILNKK